MKITRTKFAIITKTRPTQFLTPTGELSEEFDDALLLDSPAEVMQEFDTLNEPFNFEDVEVYLTVEV